MTLSLADATVAIACFNDALGVSDEVISGCESVLGAGHCISTVADSSSAREAAYYAEVRWLDPENLGVRIRLFRGLPASTELFERQVAFLARDTREQRQHAAGVIIAAGVVSNLQSTTTDPTSRTETPPRKAAKPASAPESVLPQSRDSKQKEATEIDLPSAIPKVTWGADGGPLLASGLTASQPQLGLGLRAWVRKSSLPWRAIATAAFSEGPYEPRLTSWTFGIAIATCIEQLRWLEPRIGLELSRHEIVATAPGGARSEGAQLLRYGATVGSDFVLRFGPTMAVLSSAEVSASVPAYDVWVADGHAGGAALLGWRALIGLRIGRD